MEVTVTKRHFIELAKKLKDCRPGANWDANKHVQWDLCVKAVADVCYQSNTAFNHGRFIEACGGLFYA